MGGLLPYVAKEIYGANQQVLDYMVAGAAGRSLLGSITMSRLRGAIRLARMMKRVCFIMLRNLRIGVLRDSALVNLQP